MIKVLIADDQEIVCEGLKKILQSDADLQVIAIAHNGQQAIELIEHQRPDLVLMDLQMPIMNGVQAIRQLRKTDPNLPVLVLTTYTDDKWLFDAIRAGANGYLLKDRPRQELVDAIKGTVAGESYLDPAVTKRILDTVASVPEPPESVEDLDLSQREKDILQLLVEGLSNADIAQRLFLSEGTVRNYLSGLFTKLDVSDRTQAVVVALRRGLVSF